VPAKKQIEMSRTTKAPGCYIWKFAQALVVVACVIVLAGDVYPRLAQHRPFVWQESKQSVSWTVHARPVTRPTNHSSHACSWVSMDRPAFPLRHKLLIIIFETADRKGKVETQHVVDNFQTYCDRHGYLFKLHHYDADESVGVYGTRWNEMLKYW
jgi:hypothetical protein